MSVSSGGERVRAPWRVRVVVRGVDVLAAAAVLVTAGVAARVAPETLPARLSDQEFWQLVERFSEPSGYFQSGNLVSN